MAVRYCHTEAASRRWRAVQLAKGVLFMRMDRPPAFRRIAGTSLFVSFVLISSLSFAQSPPAAGAPRLEHRSPAQLPWYDKPDFLSAITSIGALFISILALVLTSRSASAQERRQKREELRNILERLVTLREEFNSRVNSI